MSVLFLPQNKGGFISYEKIMNRLIAGVLSLVAVFTTLPASQVQVMENSIGRTQRKRQDM